MTSREGMVGIRLRGTDMERLDAARCRQDRAVYVRGLLLDHLDTIDGADQPGAPDSDAGSVG